MGRHGRVIGFVLVAGISAAAATVPAVRPPSPKGAVEAFLRAVLSADENGAMEQLAFLADEVKQDAQAMLHEIVVTGKLRRAIVQQFDARGADSAVGAKEERDGRDMLALLGAARVGYGAGSAEVTFESGLVMQMVLKGEVWKIDYDKTQKGTGGLPSKGDVAAAKKSAAAIEQLTAEVVSRRFATVQEIESRFNAIRTSAMAATTSAPAK